MLLLREVCIATLKQASVLIFSSAESTVSMSISTRTRHIGAPGIAHRPARPLPTMPPAHWKACPLLRRRVESCQRLRSRMTLQRPILPRSPTLSISSPAESPSLASKRSRPRCWRARARRPQKPDGRSRGRRMSRLQPLQRRNRHRHHSTLYMKV